MYIDMKYYESILYWGTMNPTSDILQSLLLNWNKWCFWRCGGFWLCIGSISVPGISRLAMLSSMPKSSHLNKIHNAGKENLSTPKQRKQNIEKYSERPKWILSTRFWTLSSISKGGWLLKMLRSILHEKTPLFGPSCCGVNIAFARPSNTSEHVDVAIPPFEKVCDWGLEPLKKNVPQITQHHDRSMTYVVWCTLYMYLYKYDIL